MSRLRAVIFDFDGVIVESAEIKTRAFYELFKKHDVYIDQIVDYHRNHMGLSRFHKFRFIFENILCEDLTEEKEKQLGSKFSDLVLQEIIAAPFVAGVREFLYKNSPHYDFFIASGTPGDELESIVEKKGIAHLFKEIHGSPEKKADIAQRILLKYDLSPSSVIFVGDASSDLEAASKNGIPFVARMTCENKDILKDYQYQINDITELTDMIAFMEDKNVIGG